MDVVMLAPVSPFNACDGHQMAVASDVSAVLDNNLTLGVIAFLYGDQKPPVTMASRRCEASFFAVRKGSFPVRFCRGLFTDIPPSSERLYSPDSIAGVRSALKKWKPRIVIVNDVSMAGYVPLVREITPGAKVILRTHNVMQDVRREHLAQAKGLVRLPVAHDFRRYCAFETAAMANCDRHWAISREDADRAQHLYGRSSHCLSVSIPQERYAAVELIEGKNNSFVHVGTLDFRRRLDLELFLRSSWPKIRAAVPHAAITFAGKLFGRAIEAPGAVYSGPVIDDSDAYRRGRFALNFQNTTGGIKLKTLTSLAAGRTLISTPRGVEGLRLVAGKHYWDMESFLSLDRLQEVIEDRARAHAMGQEGREWVATHHSRAAIASQFQRLLGAA